MRTQTPNVSSDSAGALGLASRVCDLIQDRVRLGSSSLKGDVLECILHRPLNCLVNLVEGTMGWTVESTARSTVEGEDSKVGNRGATVVEGGATVAEGRSTVVEGRFTVVKGGSTVERGHLIGVSSEDAADVGANRPTSDVHVHERIGAPSVWSLRWWGGAGGLTFVEEGDGGDWDEEGAWGERERSPGLTPQLSPEEETEDFGKEMGLDDHQGDSGEKSEWRMEQAWVQDLGKCVDATPIALSLSRVLETQCGNGTESNGCSSNYNRNGNGLSMVIAGSHANILRSFELHVSKTLNFDHLKLGTHRPVFMQG